MSRGAALRMGAYASTWFIWGSTYLAIRFVVETLPPLFALTIRCLAAGAILLAWARLRGDAPPSRRDWIPAIATGAVFFLVGHGTLFWAEQRVASGPAALMLATEHSWVVLIAWMASSRAPSRQAGLGVLAGLAGVAMLSLGGGAETGMDAAGVAALLLSAIAWGGGSLYYRGPRRPASGLYAAGMPLLAGGVMLLAASALTGETARVHLSDFTPLATASLLYLTIFGSVVAFTAFTWLVEHEGPSRAASFAYVNPLVAVLLGWGVGGEPVTARLLLAGAVIVAAVLLVVYAPAEAPARNPFPRRRRTPVPRLTEREA